MPLLLLTAAFVVVAVLFLFLFARQVDRRFKLQDPEPALTKLSETVARLEERIRNLEAIVTTEAWDALKDQTPPPPQVEQELPDPEKAARLAKRLKS